MDINKLDRMKGSFFGLAIGDALGVPLEFHKRDELPKVTEMIGQGPFNLKPGDWTDDTSMALCITDSLIEMGRFDEEDIMRNFVQWRQTGFMSHNSKCFDIGTTTQEALNNYIADGNPYAGRTEDWSSGNGSIMRLAPIPIFYNRNINECIKYGELQGNITHRSVECVNGCKQLSHLLGSLYGGAALHTLIDINQVVNKPREQVSSSGYVVHTLDAAYWSVANHPGFEQALIAAVNLGDDSDTVGAVTGQIAGAMYGYSNIPERWLEKLVWHTKLEIMFNRLIEASEERA